MVILGATAEGTQDELDASGTNIVGFVNFDDVVVSGVGNATTGDVSRTEGVSPGAAEEKELKVEDEVKEEVDVVPSRDEIVDIFALSASDNSNPTPMVGG